MTRRSRHLWKRDIEVDQSQFPPDPVPTTTFHDRYEFAVGDRRFELYSTPGGETTDALIVWLPDERTVFTGNLTGPLFGHVPNLYTIRGDKVRSALAFIHSVDQVIALGPEVLITGHGEPIRGAEEIRTRLTQIRDATSYLREKTFEGMNAGVDLWTLMTAITLPPELDIPQGHGKVPWLVRAIWEEHIGWFRYESTTELYAVPPAAVWSDLVELAGGVAPIIARAEAHLDADRPLEALQLIDIVLGEAPKDTAALQVKLRAHEVLLERSGRENFSEVRWLESEIRDTKDALA
jgi:alkyl sulfatase BDS1-like metallo-beta-lactamase superfamily hydrolase